MCHGIRIRLTPAEEKEVKKLWGVMAPIYASVALILLAAIAVAHLPRSGDAIAVAKNTPPAFQAQQANR